MHKKFMRRMIFLFVATLMITSVSFSFAETVEESESNAPIIKSMSIDKVLLSEGETTTINISVESGYSAWYMSFYKPITGNTKPITFKQMDEQNYFCEFTIDEQTESGVWTVAWLACKDPNGNVVYFNSSQSGLKENITDFSCLKFEVIGTNADITPPVLNSISIDRTMGSIGETITVTITIEEDNPKEWLHMTYMKPSGETEIVKLDKVDSGACYQGNYLINEDTECGVWQPYYIALEDTNENSGAVYNSCLKNYGTKRQDLSSLNFEVVKVPANDSEIEGDDIVETYIIIFKDGYGKTLSTQKVLKGESATAPNEPTNELYLFDGWDSDFSNITSNKTINAKWKLNPDVIYDREIHLGNAFEIAVRSTAYQDYTITCNEDIDFSTSLTGTSISVSDQTYYGKTYNITVNEVGSYIFYVKGNKSTNTLTYKVRISEHTFSNSVVTAPTCKNKGYTTYICPCGDNYKADYVAVLEHQEVTLAGKEATCTEKGLTDGKKCSVCNAITVEQKTISKKPHTEVTLAGKEATCTEKGLTDGKKCIDCGEETVVQTIILANGHFYGEDYICDDCGYENETLKPIPEPDYGEGLDDTSCGHPSYDWGKLCMDQVCAYCGEVIKAKVSYHNTKYASCVDEYCMTCGEFVKATRPHDALNIASCFEDQICMSCSTVIQPALPHTAKTKIIKATAQKDGKVETKCATCGAILSKKTIKKIKTIKLAKTEVTYTGNVQEIKVTVKDNAGKNIAAKNYIVTYKNNTKVGKATVTVKFKGNYSGTQTLTFTIKPKKIDKLTLSKISYVYDGKVKKPTVTVKAGTLTAGSKLSKDSVKIDITYPTGRKNVGTYKVTVKGKGNYTGTLTKTFTINPKSTSVKSLTKAKKAFTVKWGKVSTQATGYEIMYATNSKFTKGKKTVKVTSYKTTSKKIASLKSKTKYYVKVRTYKTIDGKKYYSDWSKYKTVTTK